MDNKYTVDNGDKQDTIFQSQSWEDYACSGILNGSSIWNYLRRMSCQSSRSPIRIHEIRNILVYRC